jgi:hypothetical protein
MAEPKHRKRRNQWDVEDYIDPKSMSESCSLYNDVRTILEDNGWTIHERDGCRGWVHDNHVGSHSMSAAFGQWRLNVEHAKYECSRKEPWSFYFDGDNRCYKHRHLLLTEDGDVGWCPSCVKYAHNRALDHGFNQEDPDGK